MPQTGDAETLALQALAWLAAEEDLLPAFLEATGAGVADLAEAAARPEFLGAVLDFLLSRDEMVVAFCDARGLPYTAPMQARAALPGGEAMHWT